MNKYYSNTTALLIIVLLGILFQKNFINEFPSYTHAWAQADRYALAKGYNTNQLNFFKPETFVLNHQFPDNWTVPSEHSITSVDFPIHDYIPAIFMSLLNNESPWIFRLYILIYSYIGLFYLFKLSMLLTTDFLKSIFIIILAATSPVFVFYQGGFLPTIPSLANAFIGVFFYANYLSTNKVKYFNICLLFLTLATLSRTTFAIPLIAILGFEFLRILKGETKLKHKILSVVFSISSILFFIFYNSFLREKYGSIFLNHILPATSMQQFIEIAKAIKHNWLTQYFSIYHYFSFFVLLAILLITKITNKSKTNKLSSEILFLTFIIFLGCIAFSLLMFRQFPAHDYYFLDTFFIPSILLAVLILSSIPSIKTKTNKYIFIIGALLISYLLIFNADENQKNRRIKRYWDKTTATINNFKNADNYLDSLDIPENAKILVLDAYAPNIPFILMNRKGYALMSTKRKNISEALKWDYDYIITQNDFFLSDIYSSYPEIIHKTKKHWDNGHISISTLRKSDTILSLNNYLGIDTSNPRKSEFINYDTIPSKNWQNTSTSSTYSLSGEKSGILTKDMEYGLSYKSKEMPELKDKNSILLFQSYFRHDSITNVNLVISITANNQNTYYKCVNLNTLLTNKSCWEKVNLIFQLPKVESEDYEFALFIWNPERTELYMDDFEFQLY